MKINFEKFAINTFNTYNFLNIAINKSHAIEHLRKEVESDFKSLNQSEVLEKRKSFLNIKNSTALHYKEHYIAIDELTNIICGIRHLNLDKNNAFISLKSDAYLSCQSLKEIYSSKLNSLFDVFKPKYIQYFSKHKNEYDHIGQCTMLQSAQEIKVNSLNSPHLFTFMTPIDQNYYTAYKEEYQKYHKENPKLKNRVPVNDLETMEISRKDDLLKLVYLDSIHIGWIAAEKLDFLGMAGIYFNEILLKQNERGKGIAKYIQKQFIIDFIKENPIVWGTIDYQNKTSMQTALHNNRRAVRYEHFMSLDSALDDEESLV